MSEIVENGLVYSLHKGIWIVGTNGTESRNAIAGNVTAPSIIVIPKKVKGHLIKEIGITAFSECKEIVTVNIFAQLTQINHHAFSRCSSLSFINIPSTLNYLCEYALYSGIDNDIPSNNSLTVIFEPGANVIEIGHTNFQFIHSIFIYYCGSNSPLYNETIFRKVDEITIYTPEPTQIFGIPSVKDDYVCSNYTIKSNLRECQTIVSRKRIFLSALFIFVYLLI